LWWRTFFLWTAWVVAALATLEVEVEVEVELELLELPQPAIPTAATITASNGRLIGPPPSVVELDSPPPG
jgi:hypothetical protein